jgi:hypothetical protein
VFNRERGWRGVIQQEGRGRLALWKREERLRTEIMGLSEPGRNFSGWRSATAEGQRGNVGVNFRQGWGGDCQPGERAGVASTGRKGGGVLQLEEEKSGCGGGSGETGGVRAGRLMACNLAWADGGALAAQA